LRSTPRKGYSMELDIWRYSSDDESTIGLLLQRTGTRELLCWTCEDPHQAVKVWGQTRIPAGRYRVTFRHDGHMAQRYAERFPGHRGMLWLRDVPGFEYVYFHIGNDEDDTAGCILWGEDRSESRRSIQQSEAAYRRVYPLLADALEAGDEVWVTIVDLDRMPDPH